MTDRFVSHAQNFEDVRLWRAFSDIERGRYLDIGTQDPVRDSVSLAFYERGWRGVNVEPTPAYAAAMRKARPDEIIIEAAVSTKPGPIEFFEIPETGISSGVAEIAQRHAGAGWTYRTIAVATVTLAGLFDLMGPDPIEWLKIDVEGMEADVLQSWGMHPARPAALVIEATAPNTQIHTHDKWHNLVTSRGYREVLFDGLSRYFVHETHAERGPDLALSPNVFDGFQVPSYHFVAGQLALEKDAAIEAVRQQAEAERQAQAAAAQAQLASLGERAEAQREEAIAAANLRSEAVLNAVRSELGARIAATELAADEARQALAVQQEKSLAQAREASRLQGRLSAQAEAAELRLNDAEEARRDLADRLAASDRELAAARAAAAELREEIQELAGKHASALAQAEARETALDADLAQLRAHVAWREGQLAEAFRLLADAPDPLAGWPRRVGMVLARAAGRRPKAIAARRAAQVEAWRAQTPLPREASLVGAAIPAGQQHVAGSESNWKDLAMPGGDGPITSVSRLLAPHDADFIRTAYEAVLGRAPDREGEAYYLGRLRTGVHKLEILKQLRRSEEGRRFIPGVAGLDRAIKRHSRANMPIFGALIRLATGAEGNGALHRHLRVLANEMAVVRAEQSSLVGAVQIIVERTQAMSHQIASIPAQNVRHSLPAEKTRPKLEAGPVSQNLDSSERRLFSKLRLFARTHGGLA